MELVLASCVGLLFAAGVYLMLGRDRLRAVFGLGLAGQGVNLLLLAAGRVSSARPAFIADGVDAAAVANPLPQALILTAVVIGFAATCLALVAVLRIEQRDAEPAA
ncbi:NADH-quinone oxidoreductase subunit K [Myxococcota bacterium]|nr:NADH-quinone oxidoreductase subunit K [Myxococcota bacterium]